MTTLPLVGKLRRRKLRFTIMKKVYYCLIDGKYREVFLESCLHTINHHNAYYTQPCTHHCLPGISVCTFPTSGSLNECRASFPSSRVGFLRMPVSTSPCRPSNCSIKNWDAFECLTTEKIKTDLHTEINTNCNLYVV